MPNQRIAELVSEFIPLNRRRVNGNPSLSVLEVERWSDLRDHLAYEFGDTPPIGAASQPRPLRVPTQVKVRYGTETAESTTIENLSEGGGFVRCAKPLAPEASLQLELEAEGELPLRLSGLVIHARELDNLDGPAGFGVAFQDLQVEDHVALLRLIDAALSQASDD